MEQKSEGICRFCLKTFSGSAMSRHLVACKARKENDARDAEKAKTKYPIYHIKLSSYGNYWFHIEMKAASTLRELDDFLRRIWLECCGHLSMFNINGVEYEDTEEQNDLDDFWRRDVASIDTSLVKALNVGDKFNYEYDFGTTTYVEGKVIAARQGVLNEKVRILARNNLYIFKCEECGEQATDYCTECEAFFCEQCLTDSEIHECGEDMALPIVNSPRMGECGYTGDFDFDDFELPGEDES
jgi:hypothetical protein